MDSSLLLLLFVVVVMTIMICEFLHTRDDGYILVVVI